ncbi:hypothetical protein NEUTE2DRAFT_51160 [Neurospora tetrasperma FGSC 2509]|nr:hypothetical protein NEUTE2DRAFT_51160 [Neurospora tetrasperma FGSC 2509]
MPSPSSDETLSANTSNSLVDTTTAGTMTSISLTSLESNSTITPPSQHSEDAVEKGKQQSCQYFNHHPPHPPPPPPHHHHHVHHSPSCFFSRSPPRPSSLDQRPQEEDQQKVQDQSIEPEQDPEQQEQSQPQQRQLHTQHQRPTLPPPPPPLPPPSSSSSAAAAQAHPNPSNNGKTALNEFITRSRSSTLYTPSDNERDEQIRIAILTRCLNMEDRFKVQVARYWGRLQ